MAMSSFFSNRKSMRNIVLCSFARTPIGKFRGSLSSRTAPQLASHAIRGALGKLPDGMIRYEDEDDVSGDDYDVSGAGDRPRTMVEVSEALMGNVVSAGIGQAPCRQAVLGAGLPKHQTVCTTINKVCSSGMKSTMLACQILLSSSEAAAAKTERRTLRAVLAGGMESMSNIPHYLVGSRDGTPLGHARLIDGMIHDGLWDIYNDQHMGRCAEKCAVDYDISRSDQDEYCIESYRRAHEAAPIVSRHEIVPMPMPSNPRRGGGSQSGKGSNREEDEGRNSGGKEEREDEAGHRHVMIARDEEPMLFDPDRIASLRPAFPDRDGTGTVTAANASSLNDGAAALLLMAEEDALDAGVEPLARILGYADAERDPVDFTTAPSWAVPRAVHRAGNGLTLSDVDYHEINEAFSVVALANMKRLGLHHDRVNVMGGAVSLGHPIGMSGARLVGSLYTVLKEKDGTIGCASICNGGGGASAIIMERLR